MFKRQVVFKGVGSIFKLRRIIDRQNENVLLITGSNSFKTSSAINFFKLINKDHEIVHHVYRKKQPYVTSADISQQADILGSQLDKAGVIICLGGGSIIDYGKLILDRKVDIKNRKQLFIAVPTTGGSGSEATEFAVVYEGRKKKSIEHPKLRPDVVVLDPQLTVTLSPHQVAISGFDALTQAIESYWSVGSTFVSRSYSRKALKLILGNILITIKMPTEKNRMSMLLASYYSGKAINISKTTICHALSYPLTASYKIPHGHAVALTLSSALEFNYQVSRVDVLDKRGAGFVKKRINEILRMLGAKDVSEAKKIILSLMENAGLESKISELRLSEAIFSEVVRGVNLDRLKNNPRRASRDDLHVILHNSY